MANKDYATDGKLGVDVYNGADTSADYPGGQFRLGTTARAADNQVAIYCYANEAIADGTGVELGASFTASASANGEFTSLYAIASGEYGWVIKADLTLSS
jgi:hypothetical protein